jgi:CIC family chloride channel protein
MSMEMENTGDGKPRQFKGLFLALRLLARLRFSDQQTLFLWAAIIGFIGAIGALAFKYATEYLLYAMTGVMRHGDHVASFQSMDAWHRILVPAVGGVGAGLVLLLANKYVRARATDYMEAVALGDGTVPVRSSLVRSTATLLSYATGASIGREGALVQLTAAAASIIGRLRSMAPARRRLLVACGGAAGLTAAYHTPLGGAIFIAEVVIGSLAMESLAPLMIASVTAVITVAPIEGFEPLYEYKAALVGSPWEIVLYPLLGIVIGACASAWMHGLELSRRWAGSIPLPLWLRLCMGGLVVGVIAVWRPEVTGTGAPVIKGLLNGSNTWDFVALVLCLKVIGTCASFGSGAVGGVFTPSLMVGSSTGFLFACAVSAIWPLGALQPATFALSGMAGFLAAAAQAPITAILMVFEMTRRYDLILPLALCTVIGYSAARAMGCASLYKESLRSGPRSAFDLPLSEIAVSDLMRPVVTAVRLNAPFSEIAAAFLRGAGYQIWVTAPNGKLHGRILLADVEPFLKEADLANTIIAGDILREEATPFLPDCRLTAALETFTHSDAECIAVVEPGTGRLLGSLARSDLFLILGELSRREHSHSQ